MYLFVCLFFCVYLDGVITTLQGACVCTVCASREDITTATATAATSSLRLMTSLYPSYHWQLCTFFLLQNSFCRVVVWVALLPLFASTRFDVHA